ncbi:MAG: RDD family protein [Candidatus Hydrogenedentota bacterium]
MDKQVQFETPENITVTYQLAGPGRRFMAVVFDYFIVSAAVLLLFVAGLLALTVFAPYMADESIYWALLIALMIIVPAFFSMAYFVYYEWRRNGQTPGASLMNIRVVMDRGFSLTLSAIIIRTLFRTIDQFPLLWIVPLLSEKWQRVGDMVAGTLVVREDQAERDGLRTRLMARGPGEEVFRFNPAQLNALDELDMQAVEIFLNRRPGIHPEHRAQLAGRLAGAIAHRVGFVEPVETEQREQFLEDLLAAVARREARELG